MSDLEWVRSEGVGGWSARDGGGGGSSPVLLGPWVVTYADITGLNPMSDGFLLHTFEAGSILLDAWAILTVPWSGGGSSNTKLQLSLRNESEYVGLYYAAPSLQQPPMAPQYPIDGNDPTGNGLDAVQNQSFNSGDGLLLPSRIRASGADLVATLDDHTGGPATAGSLDAYALAYIPTT